MAVQTCRRVFNKVQHIVFADPDQPKRKEKVRENVLPVTLLGSLMLGAIGLPSAVQFAAPLAIAQARKPRVSSNTITDAPLVKMSRSKTIGHGPSRPKKERLPKLKTSSVELVAVSSPVSPTRTPTPKSPQSTNSSPVRSKPEMHSFSSSSSARTSMNTNSHPSISLSVPTKNIASSSLPDLRLSRALTSPTVPTLNGFYKKAKKIVRPLTPSLVPTARKVHILRSNYFRNQTQFLSALEDISNRLVAVPKAARLSALRAELALLNKDLPAEVDIPMICPATLRDGWRTLHHRVVRVSPAEATVLNSAEKVPYLLMVEVLRDDFDFDPDKEQNQTLLGNLLSHKANRRRIFDLSDQGPRDSFRGHSIDAASDSVFEPAKGDIGASPLIGEFDFEPRRGSAVGSDMTIVGKKRISGGAATLSTFATPRSSERSTSRSASRAASRSASRSGSPVPRKQAFSPRVSGTGTEQPDLSALANHMRMAAHMLAQLDASSSKRPRDEVAAIKSKIIASMQVLEEQNFFTEEPTPLPTFEAIMANAAADAAAAEVVNAAAQNAEGGEPGKPNTLNTQAGAARMENDQKTSGVERKADRDDPSAATFGEEWVAKKERIRKSSPYGLCANWDLLSVIVKTGADLRQEAFACQLIEHCAKIWKDAGIHVWIKRMRILVTGEVSYEHKHKPGCVEEANSAY